MRNEFDRQARATNTWTAGPARLFTAVLFLFGVFAFPGAAAAATEAELAKESLAAIFAVRADLRQVFRADWSAVPAFRSTGMMTLEDWARLYGSKEYPAELGWYKRQSAPPALAPRKSAYVPVIRPGAKFDFGTLTAEAVLIIDDASREVLLSKNARQQWPIASITKLMTAMVSLDHGVSMAKELSMSAGDEVGGARLRVAAGSSLSVRELFDAMLVGSANNAAYALSRSTGLPRREFVAKMNAKAEELGLFSTTFADPSGIDVENTSTAENVAALGFEAFGNPEVRRATTTSAVTVMTAARETHTVKSTDDLLTDPNNGLYVLGGKTGYLIESKWNFVVKMRDSRNKPVLVVVLGSENKERSFKDAALAARWVWSHYDWKRRAAK